jgi:hypothetical protein
VVLQQAIHGSGEVVAGGGFLGMWHWDGGSSMRSRGRWGALARRMEKLVGRRWRREGAGAAVGGAVSRRLRGKQSRAEAQRKKKRGRGGPRDSFGKIEKSRDPTVN